MKTITTLTACLLAITTLQTQDFEWARAFGGNDWDYGRSITVDASGNVYTTGHFYGTADFDSGAGTFNLSAVGSADIFVQKMDSSGNFLWAKTFGGTNDDRAHSITVDASGNVYTTGYFYGTVDFDPGAGITNLSAVGSEDVFVQKMDASGNFLWAKTFGGNNADFGYSITIDASGNVYTTGYFGLTVDFDPGAGTTNLSAIGSLDIFVQKIDSSGNFLWAKAFGGTNADYGYSIMIDVSGNVYTTGYFEGTVDFDPGVGTANLSAVGSSDVFIQKMDSSGNFLWAKSFGGNNYDEGRSITVDASGNVYTTGYFYGTVDFDPGVGTSNLSAVGGSDIFVQKMDASGNFLWAKAFGGTSSSEAGYSITVDNSGNVYTTGYFWGTVDFDPGVGIANLNAVAATDIFVHKMDASGNFLWAKAFGGSSGDAGYSITADTSGNVYTTGFFEGTVDFDPGVGTANLSAVGDWDIFVHKMSQGLITGVFEIENGIQIFAYPNPSKGLVQISFKEVLNHVEITLTDLQGKVIFSKYLNATANEQIHIEGPSGMCFLSVKTPNGQSVVKLIKQ